MEKFLRINFFLCIKLLERLIKVQCSHISKLFLKFHHVPELSHSVHRGINPLPPPLKYFNSSYMLFFVTPSHKNWWNPIISTTFIFITPSYLLKVTEFLIKILQFKLFSIFFMQQLRSIPTPAQKSHPLFSSNLPLKIEILPSPLFWKFGRRLNPPSGSGCTLCK